MCATSDKRQFRRDAYMAKPTTYAPLRPSPTRAPDTRSRTRRCSWLSENVGWRTRRAFCDVCDLRQTPIPKRRIHGKPRHVCATPPSPTRVTDIRSPTQRCSWLSENVGWSGGAHVALFAMCDLRQRHFRRDAYMANPATYAPPRPALRRDLEWRAARGSISERRRL